jgi:hypothetical protein
MDAKKLFRTVIIIAIVVAIIFVLTCVEYFSSLSKSDYKEYQSALKKEILDSIYANTKELKEFHEKTGWISITEMEMNIQEDLRNRPDYQKLCGELVDITQVPQYIKQISTYYTAEGKIDTSARPDTSHNVTPLLYFMYYGNPYTILDRIDTSRGEDGYRIYYYYKLVKPDNATALKAALPTATTIKEFGEKKTAPPTTTQNTKRRRFF